MSGPNRREVHAKNGANTSGESQRAVAISIPRSLILSRVSVSHLPHRVNEEDKRAAQGRLVVMILQLGNESRRNRRQVQPFGFVTRASHSACGMGITFATNWPG